MTTHPTPKESAALLALQFIARDASAAIADLLAAAPVVPLKASFTIALDPPPSLRGFVASSSQGAVVKYTWNWGNGLQDSSAASTSWHTWQQPGSYIVGLSVYDAAGMTDHTEQTITFPPIAAPLVLGRGP